MPTKAELKIIELLESMSGGSPGGSGSSVDFGTKADTPATTDIGTFSFMSFFKRSLQKLTALIATQTVTHSTLPYSVDVSGTNHQSPAFAVNSSRIILSSNVDCWIRFGSSPIATVGGVGSFLVSAGIPTYITTITPGEKLGVISAGALGLLSVQELI